MFAFHSVITSWFQHRFGEPTEPQARGWPEIAAGRNTLIAAPTGSGKTLAAFLACIDQLFHQGVIGTLADRTQVLYVSPLRALSNDVRRNLEVPLAEIRDTARSHGVSIPEIRVVVRTGDTPSHQRQAMTRRPPHILVTTPESLYLMLTAERGREMLRTIRTVIVDEIHALARDKRGSHLALSLERLASLCEVRPLRIGLSATVHPIHEIADFLFGCGGEKSRAETRAVDTNAAQAPAIIDIGHLRALDLGIEVPPSELSAVCSLEQWAEIYQRLSELIVSHRSTLLFVNTRRMAERIAHNLRKELGEDAVAAHHGSLSREIRLNSEERLKAGQLKAIVATASLELGIDVGFIDLVCQLGSPRSIATFLQRVGRSGHSLGRVPKGRLFPLTRDELVECMALVRAIRARRLDAVEIPVGPLDILAQQIVAAVACEEWKEDDLFRLCRQAWPYRDLAREDFDSVVELLSEGYSHDRRRGAYLHRDRIHGRLRARRGARIAAITSGGAIPETGDYRVVLESDRTFVGTVNEDFAIESMAGDVFILGNTSWRIIYVRGGEVVVTDAKGQPATIPFWLGEAPGRTIELSAEVSDLRERLAHLAPGPDGSSTGPASTSSRQLDAAIAWLRDECSVADWAAQQVVNYIAAQQAAIGVVPTQRRIVFERFFDESGGMQLVVHSPFGGRINRAWGLALRKRFCRSFDFELQAAADDNGIVLSIGPQHSFPTEQMFGLVRRDSAKHILTQALLAVPMFQNRWRWNATRSLAVLRQRGGKRVPAYLQRFRSDDLLAAVFPAQTACPENLPGGDIELPDHPLVRQTVYDCLHEAMDVDRWLGLLEDIEAGRLELVARDTREPSPFCHQLLNAQPYAFLDDAPLEERRARAVQVRRSYTVDAMRDLGQLDAEAIAQVRAEAWPLVRDADELHDALLTLVALPASEGAGWERFLDELIAADRAITVQPSAGLVLWVAVECWPVVRAAFPDANVQPSVPRSASPSAPPEAAQAWVSLVRGRLECSGPVTDHTIASALGLPLSAVQAALEALEGEGFAMRGRFTPNRGGSDLEWCERRLLARIHRLTLDGLRRQIEPVEPGDFIRFLLAHQHISGDRRLAGRAGVLEVVSQLQGFELPAGEWEHEILPARVAQFDPGWLDDATLSGQVAWGRLEPPRRPEDAAPSSSPMSRVVPISLVLREDLSWLLPVDRPLLVEQTRSGARLVYEALSARGALFVDDLRKLTGMLPAQLNDALSELAALGLVTSDGFGSLRSLVSSRNRRDLFGRMDRARRYRSESARSMRGLRSIREGRWSLFPGWMETPPSETFVERWAWQMLRRYGVVFRDLLARESVAPAWQALVPTLRRLEARGEIRGGRFVARVAGEQFALPQSVEQLRVLREKSDDEAWAIVAASDPANLFGVVTSGPRIPAVRGHRVAIRNGRLVASLQAGKIHWYEELDEAAKDSLARQIRTIGMVRNRTDLATHETI